jgi:uncharacterized protein (TIGR02246 family)
MKMSLPIILAVFLFFGFAGQQPASMTSQSHETTQKEIKGVVTAIFQSLEKMDAEALFQSYVNSPDFILFATDGSMAGYEAARNHHVQWFKSLSSLKVTTVKDELRFLPGNVVICAWLGTFEMSLKSGGQPKMNFGITFVFNRVNNSWKVIYQQTSALPPAQEKPKK